MTTLGPRSGDLEAVLQCEPRSLGTTRVDGDYKRTRWIQRLGGRIWYQQREKVQTGPAAAGPSHGNCGPTAEGAALGGGGNALGRSDGGGSAMGRRSSVRKWRGRGSGGGGCGANGRTR
jgi:hypothetical protein